MGIFNYVDYEMPCPNCGETVGNFQTKDGDVSMDVVDYWTVNNFYAGCQKCGAWIEFIRKTKRIPISEYEIRVSGGKKKRR